MTITIPYAPGAEPTTHTFDLNALLAPFTAPQVTSPNSPTPVVAQLISKTADDITAYYEKKLGWTDSKTGTRMISGISVADFKAKITDHLTRYANTPSFKDLTSFYAASTDLGGEGNMYASDPLTSVGDQNEAHVDIDPSWLDHISAWWNDQPQPEAVHMPKPTYDLMRIQKKHLSLLAEIAAIGLTGWLPPAANNKAVQEQNLRSQVLDTERAAGDARIRDTMRQSHYGEFVRCPDDVTAHAQSLSADIANGKIALALKRQSVLCGIDNAEALGLGGKHAEIKYKDAGKTVFQTPTLIYGMVVEGIDVPITFDDSSDMTSLLYNGMRAQGFNTSRAKNVDPNEPYTIFAQEYAARYTEARMSIAPRLDETMAMQDLAQTVGYFKDSVGAIKKAYEADPAFKAKVDAFVSGIDPKAMPTPEAVAQLFAPPALSKPKAKTKH